MRVILFLVFSFFLPWHLHADSRIKINLVYVDGPGGLTYPEYYQLALDLRKYLQREIDPRIRVFRTTAKVDGPKLLQVDYHLFDKMEALAVPKYSVNHYILPPTKVGVDPYIYGWSYQTCSYYPYNNSYSTAMTANRYGVGRYWESVTAAAHEIVHQLGGQHRSGGLMRSDILLDAHEGIPLPSKSTLADVRRCGK